MLYRRSWVIVVFLVFVTSFPTRSSAQGNPATTSEVPNPPTPTTDPKEIVRRGMEMDQRSFELARNYTYQERRVFKALDKHGKEKHKQIETYDWTVLYGEPYSRLIQRDDKPLKPKDERKEQEKVDKSSPSAKTNPPNSVRKDSTKKRKSGAKTAPSRRKL